MLADRVRFVGSSEHKSLPNPLANPKLRTSASDCDEVDPSVSQDGHRLLRILRTAMQRGQVSGPWEGRFPRYVHGWMCLSGGERGLFRGRLTNREQGVYKGYFECLDQVPEVAFAKLLDGGVWAEPIT